MFLIWIIICSLFVVTFGTLYEMNMDNTDGSVNGNIFVKVNIDGQFPNSQGGDRAKAMYEQLGSLSESIHGNNEHEHFWQTTIAEESGEESNYVSNLCSMIRNKLYSWKQSWGTKMDSHQSGLIMKLKKIWAAICSIIGWEISELEHIHAALQHQNVALRLHITQLVQKLEHLKAQLKGNNKEGYMVLNQLEDRITTVENEKLVLENRIQGLLGSCVCGNAYDNRAAAVIDFELKKCTYALDECLFGTQPQSATVIVDEHYATDDNRVIEEEDIIVVSDDSDNINKKQHNKKPYVAKEKKPHKSSRKSSNSNKNAAVGTDTIEVVEYSQSAERQEIVEQQEEVIVEVSDICGFHMELAQRCMSQEGVSNCAEAISLFKEHCGDVKAM